jgi:hypothetical protein
MNFWVTGLSEECCFYNASPHPNYPDSFGFLTAWDCDNEIEMVGAGYVIINPDQKTHCGTPVEETTWGQVKALYQ